MSALRMQARCAETAAGAASAMAAQAGGKDCAKRTAHFTLVSL